MTDYRNTVFLPRTDFPMKAGLPAKEPGIAARWESEGLYHQIRKNREGRTKFIFHDGPPYANGDIHIGHALNHTLKDMVVRTQTLLGKDAPYVPGWDCHGLPIEWKVEEEYRKSGRDKDAVPVLDFRDECRRYSAHWLAVQTEETVRIQALRADDMVRAVLSVLPDDVRAGPGRGVSLRSSAMEQASKGAGASDRAMAEGLARQGVRRDDARTTSSGVNSTCWCRCAEPP